MIRSLTGDVAHIADGYVTVVVHGVGYLVGTPTKTATFSTGEAVTFYTHLAVRENALDLYGFTTPSELDVFELLLQVPKIGPKSALHILTEASPTLLLEAIGKKDAAYLHKLSGIGKKTCENIVQFLQDKLNTLGFDNATIVSHSFSDAENDAIDALVSLGYDMTSALTVIKELALAEATAHDLVKQALKQIH